MRKKTAVSKYKLGTLIISCDMAVAILATTAVIQKPTVLASIRNIIACIPTLCFAQTSQRVCTEPSDKALTFVPVLSYEKKKETRRHQ